MISEILAKAVCKYPSEKEALLNLTTFVGRDVPEIKLRLEGGFTTTRSMIKSIDLLQTLGYPVVRMLKVILTDKTHLEVTTLYALDEEIADKVTDIQSFYRFL